MEASIKVLQRKVGTKVSVALPTPPESSTKETSTRVSSMVKALSSIRTVGVISQNGIVENLSTEITSSTTTLNLGHKRATKPANSNGSIARLRTVVSTPRR